MLVSMTTSLANVLHDANMSAPTGSVLGLGSQHLLTDLTGPVDITCVWKLKGLAAPEGADCASSMFSSADMSEGTARRVLREVCLEVGSEPMEELGSLSSMKSAGGVGLVLEEVGYEGSMCKDKGGPGTTNCSRWKSST